MAKKDAEAGAPRGRTPNPDAKNGVAPPNKNTASALVWQECERSAKKNNGAPVPKDVIEAVLAKNGDMATSTIKTQIARWRQYNGLVTQRG